MTRRIITRVSGLSAWCSISRPTARRRPDNGNSGAISFAYRWKCSTVGRTTAAKSSSLLAYRAYRLPFPAPARATDRWTGFSKHFTHLKTGEPAKDQILLLTAILADGINLGISKMAEACPGTTARKLDWLASLHIRDEAYTKALAELVNHHHRHPFSEHWGEVPRPPPTVSASAPADAVSGPGR